MSYERRRGRVVRAARLWCRKSPYRVSSRLGDWKTLSVNPAENGYLFRIREGQGSERRGMGSAFHQLCPRYSGTLIPTAPTAIRLWDTFTFTMSNRLYTSGRTYVMTTYVSKENDLGPDAKLRYIWGLKGPIFIL